MDAEVQFLRLKNGEDIIAEITETDNAYILMYPCKVLYLKGSKPGFVSISLMQWVFAKISSEQVFDIDKSEVLFKIVPDQTLITHYWDSVEHFMNTEAKSNVEYDKYAEEYDEDTSLDEGLELLKQLLDSKPDKNKLN